MILPINQNNQKILSEALKILCGENGRHFKGVIVEREWNAKGFRVFPFKKKGNNLLIGKKYIPNML